MSIRIKTLLAALALTLAGTSAQAQDLLARQAPVDKKMKMVEIPAETLSVDTKTDLIVVRNVIQRRINDGEIVL